MLGVARAVTRAVRQHPPQHASETAAGRCGCWKDRNHAQRLPRRHTRDRAMLLAWTVAWRFRSSPARRPQPLAEAAATQCQMAPATPGQVLAFCRAWQWARMPWRRWWCLAPIARALGPLSRCGCPGAPGRSLCCPPLQGVHVGPRWQRPMQRGRNLRPSAAPARRRPRVVHPQWLRPARQFLQGAAPWRETEAGVRGVPPAYPLPGACCPPGRTCSGQPPTPLAQRQSFA